MLSFLFRCIRRYPLQIGLLLFNTGILAWLQNTGHQIATLTGVNLTNVVPKLPLWLQPFISNNLEQFGQSLSNYAWGWFGISLILTLIIKFVKGILKWFIFLFIVGVGGYLVLQNQDLLNLLLRN